MRLQSRKHLKTSHNNSQTNEMQEPQYRFTESQDWFSPHKDAWRAVFGRVTASSPRVLEIGSWEGRSAVFLLTELCRNDGELVCVDHFDLLQTEAGRGRYAALQHNLSLTGKPHRIIDDFSVPGLMTLLREEMSAARPGFDWVYIDGSHEADDTFLDGELAWRLARKGAIFVFDDYHWNLEPEDSIRHPKRGIDGFLVLHAGQYTRLSSDDQYQMILQKTTDMRIGFLMKDNFATTAASQGLPKSGINVALAIDDGYAIAAAVAIRSTVIHTRGPVTFYVFSSDLSDVSKAKLEQCVADAIDKTIRFLDLPAAPPSPLADVPFPAGPSWGKIALIPILPEEVEKVLYFDADVLVRGDLNEIWDTDLRGKTLGAVPDVGYPMGHEDVGRMKYFNAGVLLMDVVRLRKDFGSLHAQCAKMANSKFKDQDALNMHCRDDWLCLEMKWNAQGLGTYAEDVTPERAALGLDSMVEPCIIHFTGVMHPSMAEALEPFVKLSGKPWGYLGAPHNPYCEEWWHVCEKTAWKGWRTSAERQLERLLEMEEAIQVGVKAFRKKITDLH
ncbi:glycosyl transferase [Dichomitus squalens]|uniref:Glycosyl transferase n=1 Tax=Dichomitus squalens TaxID=114155 RepID=A0A4Q9Q2B4_9APHY|nr:glycosyl transferase [Dichomitus squalens]